MIQVMNKRWYDSKTLWINILIGFSAITEIFGFQITPELQLAFLTIINVILRLITKENLTWS